MEIEDKPRTAINWGLFGSPYWSPEKQKAYEVVFANWGQQFRSFDEDKTEKLVIVCDVLKIDNVEFDLGRKIFCSAAVSFAEQAKPIFEAAELRGEKQVTVYLEVGQDKKYRLMDLRKLRSMMP